MGQLRRLPAGVDAAIVDCITVWVANRVLRGDLDDDVLAQTEDLVSFVASTPVEVTLVSNEVGEGVHPPTAEGRRFRDLLGTVNQRVAAAADRVVLMVAGVPLGVAERQQDTTS